ncbi:hypothetical protein SNOG_20077 [Parastagonospora nodorum SN15]|uniref:Uncharacterized protein n=1 Tax=Phaeosphaeria nodorum (strain SN15 / ATCC MYA-4574 / FGSC 10173) TaxID=321614 RepID=A9JX74_PHANO|nr:hypothetical protein SNOG_20077 [Parastagonospora nodorum SN15]EDP89766.1 hypothetical protein SNOG_20077 [Parastagonospora nodorum SN15]
MSPHNQPSAQTAKPKSIHPDLRIPRANLHLTSVSRKSLLQPEQPHSTLAPRIAYICIPTWWISTFLLQGRLQPTAIISRGQNTGSHGHAVMLSVIGEGAARAAARRVARTKVSFMVIDVVVCEIMC